MPSSVSLYEGITPLPPRVVSIRNAIFEPIGEPEATSSFAVPASYNLYVSTAIPVDSLGRNGDWYMFFDADSFLTYRKLGGSWTLVTTSSGAVGPGVPAGGTADQVLKKSSNVDFDTEWSTNTATGTVTSVSVTTANGVSGSVVNPTSTPAIALTLGAITPTSVVASGTVTGSNLSGTNTGDQTSVTGNAGTATALQTARTINGTSFNGTANITVTVPSTGISDSTAVGRAVVTAVDQAAARAAIGAGDGTGSVTTVSVVTANGVSGSVANATTTPAITVSLGAITPTSVVASGSVSGSNLSGTNTGDQTSVTGNAGTATALQNARTINGVSFNGTANIDIDVASTDITDSTSVGRSVLTAVDAAAARTAIGAGSGTVTSSGTPTSGQIAEFTSATNIQGKAVTGSGSVVLATSPTLVTPALGTPTALVLTNATSLPAAAMPALTGDVTTSAGAVATTLATVNSNVGAFTNANITVNAKGLVTAAANGSGGGGSTDFDIGTLTSDDTKVGLTITGLNAGATIAQWEAVYLGGSSTWLLADANGSGTYPARGLAVAAYSNTNPAVVLREGIVRNDAWNWTPGGTLYLSLTAGGMTQTMPFTSGEKIQQVGFALTADIAYINMASGEYLTVP